MVFAFWQEYKLNTVIESKSKAEQYSAVLLAANNDGELVISQLKVALAEQAALAISRESLILSLNKENVAKKQILVTTIKESKDEAVLNWAEQRIPDAVISLLKQTPNHCQNESC